MLCQFLWKESNPDKPEEDYDEYRKSYALNYVRTFFNQHMDDSWFRSMYSPLGKFRVATQESNRATTEAQAFSKELAESLAKNTDKGRCFFVLKSRLGGGIKQPASSYSKLPGDDYHSPSRKTSSSALTNPIPGSHLFTFTQKILPIQDVPPYVTDEQLKLAFLQNCKDLKATDLELYSSSVTSGGNRNSLFRTVYVGCTDDVRKELIQQLNHMDRAAPPAAPESSSHVPRKEDTYIPKTLQVEVECSDAYGRVDVDADGKGGAGADESGVTARKATVWVSTQPLPTPVAVLSAAVSRKDRIPKDAQSARELAKAYDIRRKIAKEHRLESVLSQALPTLDGEESTPQDTEDALDLAIAYLRRVHLFSFYNGCTSASNVADVLSGQHGASTIHLRLAIADELLQSKEPATDAAPPTEATNGEAEGSEEKEEKDTPAPTPAPPKVDLLVQRLDTAIEKSLKEANAWVAEPDLWSGAVVSPEVDKEAKEIEVQESKVEPNWIQDHALIDEDGRARCSFHFCRKLFKDSTFLKKHLIKKHSEFLRAEIAKCHDQSMMVTWDSQEVRPVPPILVDCGRAFSVVPSPVVGAAVPLAADPEPDLWRRQEERRQQEEEEEQARRERYKQNNAPGPDLNGPLSEERPSGGGGGGGRGGNFFDVDDMKEEKVELAFDNVEIPVAPPKKKKKKKKLL